MALICSNEVLVKNIVCFSLHTVLEVNNTRAAMKIFPVLLSLGEPILAITIRSQCGTFTLGIQCLF